MIPLISIPTNTTLNINAMNAQKLATSLPAISSLNCPENRKSSPTKNTKANKQPTPASNLQNLLLLYKSVFFHCSISLLLPCAISHASNCGSRELSTPIIFLQNTSNLSKELVSSVFICSASASIESNCLPDRTNSLSPEIR